MDGEVAPVSQERVRDLLLMAGAKALEQRLPGLLEDMADILASEREQAMVPRLRGANNPARQAIEEHEAAIAVLVALGPFLRPSAPATPEKRKRRKR